MKENLKALDEQFFFWPKILSDAKFQKSTTVNNICQQGWCNFEEITNYDSGVNDVTQILVLFHLDLDDMKKVHQILQCHFSLGASRPISVGKNI